VAAEGFRDWDDVCAFACTLPEVAMERWYGRPSPKVGGKAFVGYGHEPATSFVLMATADEKALLIDAEPYVFWETPHYAGSGAVLVRFSAGERAWIEDLIRRAWWDCAPRPLRTAFGDRP